MFIWSNILTDTCRRERQAIRKCIEECVTIAANAWLYLMRTIILGSSPLASESISLLFQLSVYYCFFFNLTFFTCQLPVHCLMISGGVDDVIFQQHYICTSSGAEKTQVTQKKNPPTSVTQLHVKATCKCYHTQVFLLFSHFPVFMTNVFVLFF